MKILLVILSFLYLANLSQSAPNYQEVSAGVQAKSVLLQDVATGKVLFQRNIDQKHYPASTVKLLTALLVYEQKGLSGTAVVMPEDTRVEPSHVPLIAGETVKISDMVQTLIIGSDNDSGMFLARYVSGSSANFASLMNRRARELGCLKSNFTNPHGLPDKNQMTTTRDLMKIFNRFMEIPDLARFARTQYFTLSTRQGTQRVKNHNKLLGVYPGMSSAKTGWTRSSRHTYAASAVRNGRELRLTLLNSPNKWSDAKLLFDYGFANLPPANLVVPASENPVLATQSRSVDSTSTASSSNFSHHTVKRGETVASIARRYGVTVERIARANNLRDVHRIQIGQILRIPQSE